jgi:Flp pilus assembly protein TadD
MADELQDCKQLEPRRRIVGCSQIISKGGHSGIKLPDAYRSRGLAHIETGDYDSAVSDLSEAIRLNPKDAAAYTQRGWAFGEKRQFDRAITDLDEGIRLDPAAASAYNILAGPASPTPVRTRPG